MKETFSITISQERTIRGDLYGCPGESKGTLLICHGFKGFKDWGMFPWIGQQFSQDFDTAVINLSGNGVGETDFDELEKFAKNTYSQEIDDLKRVVQAVHEGNLPVMRKPRKSPLYLLGHSKGTADCLLYTLDHPEQVNGVVAWNGSLDPAGVFGDKLLHEMKEKGRAFIQNARTKQQMPLDCIIAEDLEANRDRYNILNRLKDLRVPLILVQGTEDSARLQQGSANAVEIRPDIPWKRIAGGNHTFGAVHPFQGPTEPLQEAVRVTREWLLTLSCFK